MKETHWRTTSRRVIRDALASGRVLGLEGKDLEKHVSEAYPFGERAMWPYKIWLDEFAVQVRGRERKQPGRKAKPGPKLLGDWPGLTEAQRELLIEKPLTPLPGQLDLFEEHQ